MIRSLRFRLTAWYLGFFSLLLVLFSIFLYGVLAHALRNRLDDKLLAEANTAAGLFQDELEEMRGDAPKAAAEAVSGMRQMGSTVAIYDGRRLLAKSGTGEAYPAGLSASASDVVLPAPRRRVAVHRFRTYLVLASEPLDTIAASLTVLRWVLFFGLPFLLAVAGIGGYVLAKRNLAPVRSMAEQAHAISANSLHQRLEIGTAAEELVILAYSFNELLSRLDQSFEAMRRFVADASHELRTPLSVIRGEADVALSSERAAVEYRDSLAIILDESRRLSRLVDDLLNLARADAGRVRLERTEFYFSDLLADCCRSAQPLAAARQIALESRSTGDLAFRGDEQLLRRLLTNLLDNALRYTPPNGQVVASVERQNGGLRLRVSDTGPGICPEAAPHIFERFYRADPARSREDGGFGLGLAIVRWIAESHGGNVGFETGPAAGTTFTVNLPG